MNIIKLLLTIILSANSFAQPQTSDINKNDAQGKKDGLWRGYYPESKRTRYEGTFSHGKETGTFKFFDDTKAGTVIATRAFDPKDGSAYTTFFNQSKSKVSEGREVNHLADGEWKYYHEDLPLIMSTEHYKAGKLDGKRTVLYKSGEVAEESNYSAGVLSGSYKKYTEKGTVLEDSNYKNGKYDGPATFRDADDNITAKGIYTAGKKTGKWSYFAGGKPVKKDNTEKIKRKKPTKPKVAPDSE